MKNIPSSLIPYYTRSLSLAKEAGLTRLQADKAARLFTNQIYLHRPIEKPTLPGLILEPHFHEGKLWLHFRNGFATTEVEDTLSEIVARHSLKGEWIVVQSNVAKRKDYTSYLCRSKHRAEQETRSRAKAEKRIDENEAMFRKFESLSPEEAKKEALRMLRELKIKV